MTQHAGPHAVNLVMDRIDESTSRLLHTAAGLSDQQAREPSALPGWSRGHVLTHIARNADGLRNLLTWASTGVPTPQYPSLQARQEQIEAGSGRQATDLLADLTESARAFMALARDLPAAAWTAQVKGSRGQPHPAWFTLHRRMAEVEIHHSDLAAGYTPADWPGWFVTEQLYRFTSELAGDPAVPVLVLCDTRTGRQYLLRQVVESGRDGDDSQATGSGESAGSGEAAAERVITGPGHLLLAWLIGRDDGADLAADPAGPLPDPPPFR